jgi:hypothetical protein
VSVGSVRNHNALEVTFHLSRIRCSSRRNILASGLRRQGLRSAYFLVAVPTRIWQTPRVKCMLRYSPCTYSMIMPQQLSRAGHFVSSARIKNSENCVAPCDSDVRLETYKQMSQNLCCVFLTHCLTRNRRMERLLENLFSSSKLQPVILIHCYLNNKVWVSQMRWMLKWKTGDR